MTDQQVSQSFGPQLDWDCARQLNSQLDDTIEMICQVQHDNTERSKDIDSQLDDIQDVVQKIRQPLIEFLERNEPVAETPSVG